jgi:hypothetical protein
VSCRLAAAPDHAPELGEGKLELIMGPMFAGKTTALINRVSSSPPQCRHILCILSACLVFWACSLES